MTDGAGWVDHTADETLEVHCGGVRHTLRWTAGRLELDHHGTLDDEEALLAFGGAHQACVDHALLWRDAALDGGFIGEWAATGGIDPARRAWLRTALDRARAEGVQEYLHEIPPGRAHRMCAAIVAFPDRWLSLAAGAVAERAASDPDNVEPAIGRWLDLAVRRLTRRTVVAGVGAAGRPVGGAALVPFDCRIVDGPPTVSGRLDGRRSRLVVSVSRRWLADVWAAGLAQVDGRAVLAVDHDTRTATVVTWDHDGDAVRPQLLPLALD